MSSEATPGDGHTAGPWERRSPTRVYGNLQRDQNGTGDLVAMLVRPEDGPLVEAAPDLYAALKAVDQQTFCDCLNDGLGEHEPGCFVPLVRAALSRVST